MSLHENRRVDAWLYGKQWFECNMEIETLFLSSDKNARRGRWPHFFYHEPRIWKRERAKTTTITINSSNVCIRHQLLSIMSHVLVYTLEPVQFRRFPWVIWVFIETWMILISHWFRAALLTSSKWSSMMIGSIQK